MARRALVSAVVLVVLMLAPVGRASANGVNTHTWVSFHAIEHLPDGELKRLLSLPEMRDVIINGSVFPDGGYAAMHPFGETSHWEPFITAYLRWMQRELPRPYARGESKRHVAFLMGVASHSMGDQVFDSTFMKAARGYDAAGWSEVLLDSFDTATDVMLVDETDVDYRGAELWVPPEVAGVLGEVGVSVDQVTLENATSTMHTFVLAYGQVNGRDPAAVERYRTQYPWASEHFMDPHVVGNPLCEGEVVAAYWLSLWDRLHEVENPANMILSTYPAAGSDGHPTDPEMVESQLIVVFGRGLAGEVRDKFRITDSTGKVYTPMVSPIWSGDANLRMLEPEEPWAANQTFTVEVLPGITTVDGHTYTEGFSFQFSTRPASGEVDPMSDPTPHVGEPWTGPPEEEPGDDGGCSTSGGGGGGALVLVLGATFFVARRRRVVLILGAAAMILPIALSEAERSDAASPRRSSGQAPGSAPLAHHHHADSAPRGMLAFTATDACPPGWVPATLATGRLLVGTDTAELVGRVVGTPLAALEDRAHGHALTTAALALPFKSISAADGGNQQGASAANHPLTGDAAPASTGLPFVQLTACVVP
jgi:MYXO-CTERM domain-containing protein